MFWFYLVIPVAVEGYLYIWTYCWLKSTSLLMFFCLTKLPKAHTTRCLNISMPFLKLTFPNIWLTEANICIFELDKPVLYFPKIVFQFKSKIQLDMKHSFQKIRLTTAPATVMSRCVELCTGSTRTTTQGARSVLSLRWDNDFTHNICLFETAIANREFWKMGWFGHKGQGFGIYHL